MSRHFGTIGAEVSGHFGTSADMSYGQFGTGVEVSWVQSVSGPKCLYTQLETLRPIHMENKFSAAAEWPGCQPILSHLLSRHCPFHCQRDETDDRMPAHCPNYCLMVAVLSRRPVIF